MSARCPVAVAAEKNGDAPALVANGRTYSYAQLDGEVRRAVAWLRRQGVEHESRVGVVAANRVETVVLFHAVGRLGAALVPFNVRLSAAELEGLVGKAGCPVILADEGGQRLVPRAQRFDAWGDSADAAEGNAEEAVVAVLYTSGTTGEPKPIALTRAQFEASAAASGASLGNDSQQKWLLCLPLFHVGALALVSRCAFYGATVVLEQGFDAARTSSLVDAGQVTHASLVATALRRWVAERAGRRVPQALHAVLVGGGPLPIALWKEARALGIPVLQTYGLTEACSQVTTERLGEADGTTAGPPLPGVEVRVVAESGCDCMLDDVGEIWVRGPTVGKSTEWLRTKDLGSFDTRGRLTVHARRGDLIISGGENVFPSEVERVLEAHPLIAEAVVLAQPDAEWGQVPVALLVARDAARADEASIRQSVAKQLARYKQPRAYRWVKELPRNANGKLDRAGALRLWAR